MSPFCLRFTKIKQFYDMLIGYNENQEILYQTLYKNEESIFLVIRVLDQDYSNQFQIYQFQIIYKVEEVILHYW